MSVPECGGERPAFPGRSLFFLAIPSKRGIINFRQSPFTYATGEDCLMADINPTPDNPQDQNRREFLQTTLAASASLLVPLTSHNPPAM